MLNLSRACSVGFDQVLRFRAFITCLSKHSYVQLYGLQFCLSFFVLLCIYFSIKLVFSLELNNQLHCVIIFFNSLTSPVYDFGFLKTYVSIMNQNNFIIFFLKKKVISNSFLHVEFFKICYNTCCFLLGLITFSSWSYP